jgi:hypothetical protein
MHIHKHVSRKVIEANRRNSHHGHGPSTARGKQAVRYNAVKHGLLARALVFKSEKERRSFRAYRERLCEELAPYDSLELMYIEDLANADWRLKRATRWEQSIWMNTDMTTIAKDALESGTDKLGISGESDTENRHDLRCKELTFSLKNEEDPKAEKAFSLSGSPSGVELTAKLTDPLGNLETIIRYQRAIRRDRDNAADRLLKLQRARAKLKREHRH